MPRVRRSVARLGVGASLLVALALARADEPAVAAAAPVAPGAARAVLQAAVGSAATATAATAAPRARLPKVAIIIDDLGYRLAEGLRAARLPGPVAVAILPRTPHAERLAREAAARGKEIVLHVPMQALARGEALGPGALELDQTRDEVVRTLADDLAAVPLARAVSNHMGSSLTREPEPMRWIMEELKARGPLPFIDSYTTADSVAFAVARSAGVPALRRDVFLDGDPDPAAVEREWQRLVARAHERGFALGIGHPHEVTLALLERMLPEAAAAGVQVVPLAELLAARGAGEDDP